MSWFSRKKEPVHNNTLLFDFIQRERADWAKLVDNYKKRCDVLTEMYNSLDKARWKSSEQQPFYEFILGDKETGWCWTKPFEDYLNLNIGDIIQLEKNTQDTIDCKVISFNGIQQYKTYRPYISFFVEEIN